MVRTQNATNSVFSFINGAKFTSSLNILCLVQWYSKENFHQKN
uniref:Uncharacterized protein n=1 Tax=Arundo donax TaxID=35708 RepID=A0A0A8YBD7_ARUDO